MAHDSIPHITDESLVAMRDATRPAYTRQKAQELVGMTPTREKQDIYVDVVYLLVHELIVRREAQRELEEHARTMTEKALISQEAANFALGRSLERVRPLLLAAEAVASATTARMTSHLRQTLTELKAEVEAWQQEVS